MNQNQIKWLATLFMLLDHIGFLLEAEPMRILGRLSFPLFAWIFAHNWKRREPNSSAKPLITRLVLFGIIAQVPYILLFMDLNLNILISLAIAGITFIAIRKSPQKILYLIGGMIVAQGLQVSYGWYAVACPLLMINLKGTGDRMWWIGWTVINVIYTITCNYPFQIFALFTPLILAYHNTAKNRKPTAIEKKFFYYFYPIHLAGLGRVFKLVVSWKIGARKHLTLMNRGDLSNEQWQRLEPLLPPLKPRTGKPNRDHRQVVNGILWILRTGAPWRDLR